jgi:hypothetical protein
MVSCRLAMRPRQALRGRRSVSRLRRRSSARKALGCERIPGHRGRVAGSMSSPPKRDWNWSACLRSAKQKTVMSISF